MIKYLDFYKFLCEINIFFVVDPTYQDELLFLDRIILNALTFEVLIEINLLKNKNSKKL